MYFERTHFAAGSEPRVFTSNVCDSKGGRHEECPGIVGFDPQTMQPPDGEVATERDMVFCTCPCHLKPEAWRMPSSRDTANGLDRGSGEQV